MGFGNQKGKGNQVDLLLNNYDDLEIVDSQIVWILGFGLLTIGTPRYSVFTSQEAKKAARNNVQSGKQNNFNINDLKSNLYTWEEMSGVLGAFLE